MQKRADAGKVNELVGHFYRATLQVPLGQFRQAMLEQIREVIPFDAAVWGVASADAHQFHALTLLDLDQGFADRLNAEASFRSLIEIMDTESSAFSTDSRAVTVPDFRDTAAYREACQPYGIGRVLGTAYRDPATGLYSTVALFRFKGRKAFSAGDRRVLRHVIFHLMNAASMAGSVHLQKEGRDDGRHGSALCDRFGYSYGVDAQFTRLMNHHFPKWRRGRLPFSLPDPAELSQLMVDGLRIKVEPVGELYYLTAWRDGPLDSLTAREREIVVSVCRGLSYKEEARPLGIAPSTVSNHIYRVFEKLGITSRSELARMVSDNARLH